MNFIELTHKGTSNLYDQIRFQIAERFLLINILAFFSLCIIYININILTAYFFGLIFVTSIISYLYLKKSGHFIFVYCIFTISATILVNISFNFIGSTIHYTNFLWIIAIVLFAYIGLGEKWALIISVLNFISIFVFIQFSYNNKLEDLKPLETIEKIGIFIESGLCLIIITYIFKLYLNYKDLIEIELIKNNIDLEAQNKEIGIKNKENTTLVKEIHHRVKNNLQIIISLLRMQMQVVQSEETKDHFSEAIKRIMAISLIHEKLYTQKLLSNLKFKEYVEELSQNILRIHNTNIEISAKYAHEKFEIGLKTVVPFGLLLNELITNSLKHAFTNQLNQKIEIDFLQLDSESIVIEYKDNGVWKEPLDKNNNFGIELIGLLTEQMEGEYQRVNSHYTFKLKNID